MGRVYAPVAARAGVERNHFVQFDGWYGMTAGDAVVVPDENGRAMMAGYTAELMHGAHMRLLVEPDADPKEIVALLHQAAEWIESAPDDLTRSKWLSECPHC